MVDMVKKVHKKGSEFLRPGEQLLAACVVSTVGQFKKTVAFGAVGGVVGAAVGSAIAGKAPAAEAGSMADSFPLRKQSILGLSAQRWVLFEQSAMSGAPKGVLGEWGHDQITGIDVEPGKLTSRINLHFADGSTATLEAVKAAKPDTLVGAAATLGR
ncbi:MAG: hypothetical protein KDB21_15090 [Acidimicrobiales bacterium]|nr:hypothetical protein [Acidimicrobiales bacterium]